jgi:hypothetical protein
MLAVLRNTVLSLLRLWEVANVAAALRTLAWEPQAALQRLGIHVR